MTDCETRLTAANIRYLLAIIGQEGTEHGVRCVRVAETLGVSKPSVHTMVESMREMGLLEQCRYGMIRLTPEGERQAHVYYDYYNALRRHFAALLPEREHVDAAAMALVTTLPAEGIEELCSNVRSH